MPDRAAGFCIYDDPALAIARARRDGLRVLYLDLDVHHGDGVQAIHAADPGVMTVSLHETGRYLFPGTGDADEIGEGTAAGTVVNVPMEPFTGADPWLRAVRRLVPELAAAFGPDLIVSQHGADSHAWDPLAHLRMTTTAMDEAARLVDRVAHRFAGGRWLATGGGGYDAYRVVPRMWSLVWLAGSHLEVPDRTPDGLARAMGVRGGPVSPVAAARDLPRPTERGRAGGRHAGPGRGDVARDGRARPSSGRAEAPARGQLPAAGGLRWPLSPGRAAAPEATDGRAAGTNDGPVTVLPDVDAAAWSALSLADRVIAPFDAATGHAIVAAALAQGASVAAAVAGSTVVGLAVTGPDDALLALGVAPEHRQAGVGHGPPSSLACPNGRGDRRRTGPDRPAPACGSGADRPPDARVGRVHHRGDPGRHPKRGSAGARRDPRLMRARRPGSSPCRP